MRLYVAPRVPPDYFLSHASDGDLCVCVCVHRAPAVMDGFQSNAPRPCTERTDERPTRLFSCRMIELDSKSLNSLAGSVATAASVASGHSRKSSDASQISLNSGESPPTISRRDTVSPVRQPDTRTHESCLNPFKTRCLIIRYNELPRLSLKKATVPQTFFIPAKLTIDQ